MDKFIATEGEFALVTNTSLLCETCLFKTAETTRCEQYNVQKPSTTLYGGTCPKYQHG